MLQGQRVEVQNAIGRLESVIHKIKLGYIWNDEITYLPQSIKFDFIYPNGKNGDIDMFIASEYGEVHQTSSLVCEVVMPIKYKEQIALMSNCYLSNFHPVERQQILLRRDEINNFLENINLPLSIRRLNSIAVSAGMNITNPLRKEAEDIRVAYMKTLRERRKSLYSELVAAGMVTSKWKSEQQAYAIVKEMYPDAIYQYRSDWLEFQSLDIFIPSLSVGIEYQGAQHYQSVSCFGGENELAKRLLLDEKKKEKCAKNGVTLIEWRYDEPLTKETIKGKIIKVIA